MEKMQRKFLEITVAAEINSRSNKYTTWKLEPESVKKKAMGGRIVTKL